MDGSTHPQPSAFRTLYTSEHPYDASLIGLEGPEAKAGDDGGFAVHFDGRGSIPSLIINGSDGEVAIHGLAAIEQFLDAVLKASSMARRMAA